MPLRTPKQFVESLKDGRALFYRGDRVEDPSTHPVIARGVHHAMLDYEMAEDPRHRDLAVVREGGEEFSRYFQIPRSSEDLLQRSRLIELQTAIGKTMVVLIKEIGTDALF